MGKYKLTDEHKAELGPWAEKCVANGLSTKPTLESDLEEIYEAVRGLYGAADLTPPPRERVALVPSPFVLAFAGGFAAYVWSHGSSCLVGAGASRDRTRARTEALTWDT